MTSDSRPSEIRNSIIWVPFVSITVWSLASSLKCREVRSNPNCMVLLWTLAFAASLWFPACSKHQIDLSNEECAWSKSSSADLAISVLLKPSMINSSAVMNIVSMLVMLIRVAKASAEDSTFLTHVVVSHRTAASPAIDEEVLTKKSRSMHRIIHVQKLELCSNKWIVSLKVKPFSVQQEVPPCFLILLMRKWRKITKKVQHHHALKLQPLRFPDAIYKCGFLCE